MNGLLLNLILALVWAALNGDFGPGTLVVGFFIGFLILLVRQRIAGISSYASKAWRIIDLAAYFFVDLLRANLRIALDVLRPGLAIRPGVVAVPLDARTDVEITLLSTLILLTPGSLALDVSSDRKTLYIHMMDIVDPDQARRQIKEGFERRVLEVLR